MKSVKVKGKAFPVHAMRAYRGNRGVTSPWHQIRMSGAIPYFSLKINMMDNRNTVTQGLLHQGFGFLWCSTLKFL
jgi:hypothetical protein